MLKLSGKDYAKFVVSIVFTLVGMVIIPSLAISGYSQFTSSASLPVISFVLGVFSVILLCDIYGKKKYLGKEFSFNDLEPGEYYIKSIETMFHVKLLLDYTAGGGGLYGEARCVSGLPREIKELKRFFVVTSDRKIVDSEKEPPDFFCVPRGALYIDNDLLHIKCVD